MRTSRIISGTASAGPGRRRHGLGAGGVGATGAPPPAMLQITRDGTPYGCLLQNTT